MELIQEYYDDDAKKLHMIVDKILRKYGGIYDKDRDDFYSLANEVFAVSLRDFDKSKCNFDGFLYSNLVKKIITEIRDRNRGKRSNTKPKRDDNGNVVTDDDGKIIYEFVPDVSLDTPTGEEDNCTLGDLIEDVNTIESKLFPCNIGDKAEKYLLELPRLAREIILLKINGNDKDYIVNSLHITNKQYSDAMVTMKSSQYISILV